MGKRDFGAARSQDKIPAIKPACGLDRAAAAPAAQRDRARAAIRGDGAAKPEAVRVIRQRYDAACGYVAKVEICRVLERPVYVTARRRIDGAAEREVIARQRDVIRRAGRRGPRDGQARQGVDAERNGPARSDVQGRRRPGDLHVVLIVDRYGGAIDVDVRRGSACAEIIRRGVQRDVAGPGVEGSDPAIGGDSCRGLDD